MSRDRRLAQGPSPTPTATATASGRFLPRAQARSRRRGASHGTSFRRAAAVEGFAFARRGVFVSGKLRLRRTDSGLVSFWFVRTSRFAWLTCLPTGALVPTAAAIKNATRLKELGVPWRRATTRSYVPGRTDGRDTSCAPWKRSIDDSGGLRPSLGWGGVVYSPAPSY